MHRTDRSLRRTPASPAASPATICVVGAGYVGLTTAACMAELGHTVRCLESDPGRFAMLERGQMPIFEPGLGELVAEQRLAGRLSFHHDVAEAMRDVVVALLCVGTPPRLDGDPDLRQLSAAGMQVVAGASGDVVLVVKSTVPPGSCEALEVLVSGSTRPGRSVAVASNPEFLREGRALHDFRHPDRVVVGAEGDAVLGLVGSLYPADAPLLRCDRRSAELVKYAANTFLAVKISFANEVATLCERLGASAAEVLAGVGLDERIGEEFLTPGPGFGGSCLPKDVSGYIAVAASVDLEAPLARAARVVNGSAVSALVEKLEHALGSLAGRQIGLLGLAFKPGTDDSRDSPSLALVDRLVGAGASVRAHDPMCRPAIAGLVQLDSEADVAEGCDAIVVATAWPSYRDVDPEMVRAAMAGHVVLDAVGLLDLPRWTAAGFDVYGVGRGQPTRFSPVLLRPLEWMLPAAAGAVAP